MPLCPRWIASPPRSCSGWIDPQTIASRSVRSARAGTLPDMRQPNLKDVANAAGVHVATASRALNEHTASMVSPDTVERVREAAEALGYRVNRVARGLKMRRSFTVGMLIPDITNPFFPPMVRGAEDGLAESGFTLVLADTDNDEEKDRKAQTVFLERQVDGMLL